MPNMELRRVFLVLCECLIFRYFFFLSSLFVIAVAPVVICQKWEEEERKKYESSKMHSCLHSHICSISSALNHFFATIKSIASYCRVVHVKCSLFVHEAKQLSTCNFTKNWTKETPYIRRRWNVTGRWICQCNHLRSSINLLASIYGWVRLNFVYFQVLFVYCTFLLSWGAFISKSFSASKFKCPIPVMQLHDVMMTVCSRYFIPRFWKLIKQHSNNMTWYQFIWPKSLKRISNPAEWLHA